MQTTEPDSADTGPLSPPQVRALKIAIVVMGIMIVVGLLVIIGRMFYLASNRPPQATSTAATASEARIALPAGSTIRGIALDGDRLAIHYESSSGAGIAVMDIAAGRVLGRYSVVPDAPRP